MNVLGLIFLVATQFITGFGCMELFRIRMKPLPTIAVSMIAGTGIFSFLPLLLQLCKVPITFWSVFAILLATTVLFSIPLWKYIGKKPDIKLKSPAVYEYPFLIVITGLVLFTIWSCFYYPPQARDMLTGPELMAKYAIREHTMINSMFLQDLHTTNNYLKPPSITSLQIIYKLFVMPFGQTWLNIICISIVVWLYSLLKEKLHPVIACFLLLAFMATPELYAHAIIISFDYSNMVFFFGGFYFLTRFLESGQRNELLFSSFMFGLATYMRVETLLLLLMFLPLLWYTLYKSKAPMKDIAIKSMLLPVFSIFFYVVSMGIFVRYYIPIRYSVTNELNAHLGNLGDVVDRLVKMNTDLLFSRAGMLFFGDYIIYFYVVLVADILIYRKKFTREGYRALYGIAVVYIGLPVLSHIFPLMDLLTTIKRGVFKMWPIIILYWRNSGFLTEVSRYISDWEHKTTPAAPAPAPSRNSNGKKGGKRH